MENLERITKISIPDEDAANWINTLRESNLSDEKIDLIMVKLNETYRELKGEEVIESEINKIKESILKENKYHLNDEQVNDLRKFLEKKFNI